MPDGSRRVRFGLRRRPADGAQRGETLVELLATVVLMGTAIIGLVTLMLSLTVAMSSHRRSVRSGNEAITIAESIERAPYVACTGANDQTVYNSYLSTAPGSPYTATVESIEYLTAASLTGTATGGTAAFQSTCPSGVDRGAQRITVLVRAAGSTAVQERVVLVKRATACPNTYSTVAGQTC